MRPPAALGRAEHGTGRKRTRRRVAGSQRQVGYLLLVHPVPRSNAGIVQVAMHFVHGFSAAEGKLAPAVSEDAAAFLRGRRWQVNDLAARVQVAVKMNQGSLITAADLTRTPEREARSF